MQGYLKPANSKIYSLKWRVNCIEFNLVFRAWGAELKK